MKNCGLIPYRKKQEILLFSGDHPDSYSMGSTAGCDDDNFLLMIWLRMCDTIPPLPHRFSWHEEGHYMHHWWTTFKNKGIKGLETKWTKRLLNFAPWSYISLKHHLCRRENQDHMYSFAISLCGKLQKFLPWCANFLSFSHLPIYIISLFSCWFTCQT